jgi:hypothetical protein
VRTGVKRLDIKILGRRRLQRVSAVVPSYLAKISRAEKHLVELHEAIDEYAASRPYAVRKWVEGKKKKPVWRLAFTQTPANTDIPIIAADVIYNLRSALDHLMSCLVANKDRSSVIFPIMFAGVWKPHTAGDDAQRAKLRARWNSDTKSVKPEALAILKALQPPNDTGDGTEANRLRALNSFSNRDRHERLPIIATGLDQPILTGTRGNGREYRGLPEPNQPSDFAHDDARLKVPPDSMKVEIEGTPLVVIQVGKDERGRLRYLRLPQLFDETIPWLKLRVTDALIPYVRR